ncbi:MAG: hypothetical protein ACTMH0_02130 [Brevibacterium linens]
MVGRRAGFRKTIAAGAAVLALTVGLSGCFGPDLSDRAHDIGGVLSTKPGVEDVRTVYQNGFDSGRLLAHTVTMSTDATHNQAVEVAATFDQETGSEFDRYDQELTLVISHQVIEMRDSTSSDIMEERTPHLLALASELSADRIEWDQQSEQNPFDDSLRLTAVQSGPFRTLSVVRAELGSESFELRTKAPSRAEWMVAFPYSEQAQNRLETAISPILGQTDEIRIEDDQVSSYRVEVHDGPAAVGQLREKIERIDTVNPQPWDFHWNLTTGPNSQWNPGWVNVGGCDYGEEPDSQSASSAQTLEDQLRALYDTCQ